MAKKFEIKGLEDAVFQEMPQSLKDSLAIVKNFDCRGECGKSDTVTMIKLGPVCLICCENCKDKEEVHEIMRDLVESINK